MIQEVINIPYIEEYKDTDKYTYKVSIPLTNHENVDSLINEYIYKEIDNFLQYENNTDKQYDLFTDYSIYTHGNIISYIIRIYEYIGGVHYVVLYKEFTYDDKGNILYLRDFFNDDSYLERLSKLSYKGLLSKYKNSDSKWVKEGSRPIEENYSLYYFSEDGLNIVFPPNQAGSWAEGEMSILIKYNDIKDILKLD